MNPIPPARRRMPLKWIIYLSLLNLNIVGGIALLFFVAPGIVIVWFFSLGIMGEVVAALPSKWFGEASEG